MSAQTRPPVRPGETVAMRIVIAPDSFKGSLMAWDVAAAIACGARAALPGVEVRELPLGDGGEGTARAIAQVVPGAEMIQTTALDPLGRTRQAEFALLPGGKAVVEMAAATGLGLLTPEERNPLHTDSRGTGQLIIGALDYLHGPAAVATGCEPTGGRPELILGVGGSATVDGGVGMLTALGVRFFDREGQEITAYGGLVLGEIAACDPSGLDGRLQRTTLTLASDVGNPLLGADGAAAVFGPQKGAGPAQVELLEMGLANLREVVRRDCGVAIDGFPGAGAAGGIGGVAVGVLGAAFRPGIEIVLELMAMEEQLAWADLVITGEGRFDEQTLRGKAAHGIAVVAARAQVPVCVLSGQVVTEAEWRLPGEVVAFAIADGPLDPGDSEARVSELLERAARRVVRLFWLGSRSGRPKERAQ